METALLSPLRRAITGRLVRIPGAWLALRHYVRYAPPRWAVGRLNRGVSEHLARHHRAFTTRTVPGFLIAGDTRDWIQRHIFVYGVWEPHLSAWIAGALQSGDGFVDVGANIGYFSLLASRAVGARGRVVAIEASPSIFETLEANLRLNRAGNVRALNCAAADVEGVVHMFRGPSWNLGASTLFSRPGYDDEGLIAAHPLHSLLAPEEIAAARIVKIDTEGAEVSVVEGLLPVLDAGRHDLEVVVEVGGSRADGAYSAAEAAARIMAMVSPVGFNVYRIWNSYDADAYISRRGGRRPARITAPDEITEECDLVLSRRDAREL